VCNPPDFHEEVHMQSQQSEHPARIEQLRAHMRDQGYGSVARRNYPPVAHRFLEYLEVHGKAPETTLPCDVEGFLRGEQRAHRKRHGRAPPNVAKWRRQHTAPVRLILQLTQGQWPPEPVRNQESRREIFHRTLLEGYDRWMNELRGLAMATREQRIERARELLSALGKRSAPGCCKGDVEEALAQMRWMMQRLKLTINEAKTRVCQLPHERFDFLGYTFGRC
jgi:hypothetical protein